MIHPWLGIVLTLGVLAGLMAGLSAYRRAKMPHPEIPRKLLHVGMGLATLTFPWVFNATWPVWVLAGVSVLLLLAVKLPGPWQARLGGVVDVERASLGDLYFPISVALIFQFSDRQPILYCIPVLLLTLADATAALIGVFYGHRHYAGSGGVKSVEGSVAFFTVAFMSTHVPLLLFTETGRAETLLLAATIGLLVMLIEAIAWNGLDNLLVPLGGFLLLVGYLPMPVERLVMLLLATVLWVVFVFVLRSRSTLNDGALFGAALVGYLTWSLGGWAWVLPPLLFYIAYPLVWPNEGYLRKHPHDIRAVVAICTPGLLLLSLARTTSHWELLFPYTVGYAAQLAFVGIGYARELQGKIATPRDIALASAKCWAVLLVPFALLQGISPWLLKSAVFALLVVLLATALFNRMLPKPGMADRERFPWLPQAMLGALASVLSLAPLIWMGG
ncbi:MAG: diacylglycerol/polyprenol kinase family protein [Armatimonadota bacterium]